MTLGVLARFQRRPGDAVTVFIAAQLSIWTLVPLFANHSLPLDVVREGLSWGQEWQWGYFKHPPLTSWAVNLFFEILGDFGPYFLSQLCIALTLYFAFRLGREMFDEMRAALATLLLGGVYYFSWPTPEFNHNIAQMPIWASASYFFYKGLKSGAYVHWVALGAVAGLGLLSKYSVAVLLVTMVIFMLSRAEYRPKLISGPSFAALGAMIVIFAPNLVWLAEHDFQPLFYLDARAGGVPDIGARILAPVKFLLAQAADHIPMLMLLAAAALIGRQVRRPTSAASPSENAFLLTIGLGPAALTAVLALASGAGLRDMWGAPMWSLSGLLAVNYFVPQDASRLIRPVAGGVAVLLIAVPAAYALASIYGTSLSGKPSRTAWPDRALAAEAEKAWHAKTRCPLKIVAGENWLAGLVSARAEGRPSVLIEGKMDLSPWIAPEDLTRDGALVIWQVRGETTAPPAHLAALSGFIAGDTIELIWPRGPDLAPLRVGWGIVPPAEPCNGGS